MTENMTQRPKLDVFPNAYPQRDYMIKHTAHEFTSICPVTGNPDFGTMKIEYIADELCVELKSLKLYLNSYRNEGVYYEKVTNMILDDLVEAIKPRYMRIESNFTVRGGISSIVEAVFESEN